jgi:L-alanine-DL-glutamate epimerase-like enolase superfamily enzyme
MEIDGIETIEFRYESTKTRDEKGHGHPGEPREATKTVTRVAVEGGPDGYCVGGHREANDRLTGYLVGEDPLEREQIWQRMERTQRLYKGMLADGRISAIDCALWDVAGKHAGLPVYKLLGGHRDRVPAYASTMVGDDDPDGLGTPGAYADFAQELVDQGHPAVKLDTWMPPYSADVERDIEAARAVRERVGPDVDLMVDAHHYYSRTEAYRLGEALDDLDYLWIEEPMNEYSMSAYEWLTRELDIPVIGPETAEGRMQTRAEWIKRDIADISRVGVTDVGGLTPAVKTVNLCEAFNVRCEVHGGNAANLHLLGAMASPGEYYERGLLHPKYDYESSTPWLCEPLDVIDDEGYVQVPQEPGLGYDFDWEVIDSNRTD